MTQRRKVVSLLLALTAFALLSLVMGASYLETMLPGGLPIGNALSAIGLCAPAGAAVALSSSRTALRRVSVAALIAAISWLPVSIALAGNLALNFQGDRGEAWLIFSAAVGVAVFCTLGWALIAALISRYRRGVMTR